MNETNKRVRNEKIQRACFFNRWKGWQTNETRSRHIYDIGGREVHFIIGETGKYREHKKYTEGTFKAQIDLDYNLAPCPTLIRNE